VASDARAVLEAAVRSASVTRAVIVEPGAIGRLAQVVREVAPGRACRIVADPNTLEAAGREAEACLRAANLRLSATLVLAGTPRLAPRAERARDVARELASNADLPIAVGAGVINDVTKYASGLAQRPYVCVATAASMDGYAASGAAMLDDGFKRTLACAPPLAVVADLVVIARAPARMAPWGYGDLAGKLVAGADWILADAVDEDPLATEPFALVQDNVKRWLSDPARVAAHDVDALRGLMDGLLVAGFAMQAHGNSRPASGSDHLLSHLWEMERVGVGGEPAAHGACVGVGAVAMLALYEWFLAQDVPAAAGRPGGHERFDAAHIGAEVAAAFPEPSLAASARIEMNAKLARAERRALRVQALAAGWDALRERIRGTVVPAGTLEAWLAACGAASHPGDLGIALSKLATDYRRARLIRRRYTLLDALEDLGWLDRAIEHLFGPGGYWGQRPRRTPTPAL